jgi:hypothetical protein
MTIRPGESWGKVGPVPPDVTSVADDAELAAVLDAEGWGPAWAVAPRAGDCRRAAGGQTSHDRLEGADTVALLPWDVLEVRADDQRMWAVAHVIARGVAWSGDLVAVMNVDHLGDWDVAPRAHPNDALADVVRVDPSMGWRARWQARRRLPLGTHIPHPKIQVRRGSFFEFEFERPRQLWVDGTRRATVRRLQITVHPDRLTLCV